MRVVKSLNLMLISIVLSFSFYSSYSLAKNEEQVHGSSFPAINFGLVVKNSNYVIYRSSALGSAGLNLLRGYLNRHALLFPKTIIYMNKGGYIFPSHFAIEEYEESFSETHENFTFFHPFGTLRTYVDGENPYYPTDRIDSPLVLGREAQKYFSFKGNEIAGGVDTVLEILKIVLDPERQPVLFHCEGGLHRTGMIAMLLRFIQGGYWVDGPRWRYGDLELNAAEYEYYKFNPVLFRENNIKFVEEFSQDPRFLELKDKYQEALQDDESRVYWEEFKEGGVVAP